MTDHAPDDRATQDAGLAARIMLAWLDNDYEHIAQLVNPNSTLAIEALIALGVAGWIGVTGSRDGARGVLAEMAIAGDISTPETQAAQGDETP